MYPFLTSVCQKDSLGRSRVNRDALRKEIERIELHLRDWFCKRNEDTIHSVIEELVNLRADLN
jgi:hypothetical protein